MSSSETNPGIDRSIVDDCKTLEPEDMKKAFRSGEFTRAILVIATMAMFLFTSFAVTVNSAVASAATDRVLTIGMGESVMSANPWVGIYDSDYIFYSYVYDYLIYPDEDGVATPDLATSWWYMNGSIAAASGSVFSKLTHNATPTEWPMGSIWEYNLTDEAYWNDGVQFTATDVKFTYDIQIGINFAAYWAYQPYTRWINYVEIINDFKVRIYYADYVTKNPVPVSWGFSLSCAIIPAHAFVGKPAVYVAQTWKGFPAIGTGPFMGTDGLEYEIIAGESITLERNRYFNFNDTDGVQKGLGHRYNKTLEIDKVVMKFFSEEQTLVLNLRTGGIDSAKINAANYLSLLNMTNKPAGMELVSIYSSTVYSKGSHFNVKASGAPGELNPGRLDPAVHRAGALACNKSAIVNSVFKGLGSPGIGMVSPVYPKWFWEPSDTEKSYFNVTNGKEGEPGFQVIWGYNKTMKHVMDYDIAFANRILDAAGYVWDNSTSEHVRRFGPIAADRLVSMKIIADASAVLNWKDPGSSYVGPRSLIFEDIIERETNEEILISKQISANWKDIGIKLTDRLVDQATWNARIYSYQYDFTETYWSGDPDPNYLLYVMTTYSISGWNEWGTENETYDHAYNMQARIFDYTERRHWVNECLEWQYLSGHYITTVYQKANFGYNDRGVAGSSGKWTNWGNWTEHPGLAIDHFWGETPIFFRLKWIGPPDSGDSLLAIIIAVAVIAAVAIAVIIIMRARKTEEKKMLEKEEEEEVKEGPPEEGKT